MKISGRSVVFTLASAVLAVGALAAPAAAEDSPISRIVVHTAGDGSQPPAELGNPKEWGVVTLALDDLAGEFTPKTIIEVGGGTWSYGWEARNDQKYCYSNYYHRTVDHGSTVKIANGTVKAVAFAGQTSNANRSAGFAYTCETYYAKY
ncbi:Bacteriocin [Streptomyces sp. S4.7]|uniref:lactococcin 972 family bacteriocin n=1 Tax=Streptomyces sp. S4.7 TaxID=2705439 RepID=UPI00139800D5|nr:lactococcin 972 family bacteriocin [Streptomyces sp. S4.7]QHY97090.1 Bacteriocin [Streptomyces sp. S4.7]